MGAALSSRRWRMGRGAGSGGDEQEPLPVGRTGEERETTWRGLGRSVQLGCLGLLGQGAQASFTSLLSLLFHTYTIVFYFQLQLGIYLSEQTIFVINKTWHINTVR